MWHIKKPKDSYDFAQDSPTKGEDHALIPIPDTHFPYPSIFSPVIEPDSTGEHQPSLCQLTFARIEENLFGFSTSQDY